MLKSLGIMLGVISLAGCVHTRLVGQDQADGTCGGIAGLDCPDGYVCYYPDNANFPDAAGQCIPEYVDYGDVTNTNTASN